jgi:hypothetical protein
MGHRLSSQTQAIFAAWTTRPLQAVSLILLLTVVTLSGPCACLVHCWLREAAHHPHHLHSPQDAPLGGMNSRADGTGPAHGMHHTSDSVPTALTIAIVLLLSLVPQLLAAAFHLPPLPPLVSSITIPPLRRPPRPAHRFTC